MIRLDPPQTAAVAFAIAALVVAFLYVFVERAAIDADDMVICTNGRVAWSCATPFERVRL